MAPAFDTGLSSCGSSPSVSPVPAFIPDAVALKIALEALNRIARCSEKDCERYVAKVDEIAVEALVRIEAWEAE